MTEPKHCGLCGDRHHGECNPGSFNYFQCDQCQLLQRLPWDAVTFCGMDGMYCGCGEPARTAWRCVTYAEYQKLQKEDNDAG